MRIEDIYEAGLLTADAEASLEEVAAKLEFYEVGALPLFSGKELVGIITERDIVRAVAAGSPMKETRAIEFMSEEPATVDVSTGVEEAAGRMVDLHARHLPVTRAGQLAGMLSARDVMAVMSGRREAQPDTFKPGKRS